MEHAVRVQEEKTLLNVLTGNPGPVQKPNRKWQVFKFVFKHAI
jgi:hypothetical protein